MPVHLHIDHLIVEGAPFAPSDSAAFRSALERELAALVAQTDAGDWSENARKISVKADPISPSQPSLSTWAAASARSLFRAIQPPPRQP